MCSWRILEVSDEGQGYANDDADTSLNEPAADGVAGERWNVRSARVSEVPVCSRRQKRARSARCTGTATVPMPVGARIGEALSGIGGSEECAVALELG